MAKNLKANIVIDNGNSNITVYKRGETKPYIADSTHPMWDKILAGVTADDVKVLGLFHLAEAAQRSMLSERVGVANGKLYFDGDEVNDVLAQHIVETLAADQNPNVHVRLLENIQQNPNPESRQLLFRFLATHKFTITTAGNIVGYKGVDAALTNGKRWKSTRAGIAIVNGVYQDKGSVYQDVGDVVEMPRSKVTFDPNDACSSGLHVGNWGYVKEYFSHHPVLRVEVNPRDVVSVPHDANDSKMRVCRYVVTASNIKAPHSEPVIETYRSPVAPLSIAARPKLNSAQEQKEARAALSVRTRYPKPDQWDETVRTAKRQRKGLKTYIAKKYPKWSLINGRDGKDRKDWSV